MGGILLKRLFGFLLCLGAHAALHAEVIAVPFLGDDIPTAYWSKPNARATLIFLPGGDGSFGIASKTNPQPTWLLKTLSEKGDEELAVDLVFLDSKTSLGWQNGNVEPRRGRAHLDRLAAVIDYYYQKKPQPIILMGHSNGAISVAEFLNQAPESQAKLGGVIFSGGRNETMVTAALHVPVQVLHHKEDSNGWTRFDKAKALYLDLKSKNSSSTELAVVEGGFDEGNPANSGRHMYAGSLAQAGEFVQRFIVKSLP
jgi:dienelactone hydrolase